MFPWLRLRLLPLATRNSDDFVSSLCFHVLVPLLLRPVVPCSFSMLLSWPSVAL
ncbi:hypothetical protein BCR44DRAFT_1426291, partial [Catenaria anguillulae PL171]